MLSIWDFSVESWLRQQLESLGFKQDALTAVIQRRTSGQATLPLLVRPVKENSQESDWHVGGLDVRRIGSWFIKGVCSDAE